MVLEFSADPTRIDRALVHHWLSDLSYWAKGRSRETLDRAIDGSRVYGVYADGTQVAFARVVTDGATFAWLCDVFVDPESRGAGHGKALMTGLMADIETLGLRRILLMTSDAHGLYAQYGFTPLENPEAAMVKWFDFPA